MQELRSAYRARVQALEAIKAAMAASPLFSPLDEAVRLTLAARFRRVAFEDGCVVLSEGERSAELMYVVEEGEAEVSRQDVGMVKRCGSGEFFGELALITDEPRQACPPHPLLRE